MKQRIKRLKINKTELVLEKDKIEKPPASLTKEKREDSNKIRNKRKVTTDNTETQRITEEYYERLYSTKLHQILS